MRKLKELLKDDCEKSKTKLSMGVRAAYSFILNLPLSNLIRSKKKNSHFKTFENS
jgi:hypothetical protein